MACVPCAQVLPAQPVIASYIERWLYKGSERMGEAAMMAQRVRRQSSVEGLVRMKEREQETYHR